MTESKQITGNNIRRLRTEAYWASQELADKVGVSRGTVSDWENAKKFPIRIALQKLADVFDVPIQSLAGEYVVGLYGRDVDMRSTISLLFAVPNMTYGGSVITPAKHKVVVAHLKLLEELLS
jgi:transcriptional regulator with XRE-family HTH domain